MLETAADVTMTIQSLKIKIIAQKTLKVKTLKKSKEKHSDNLLYVRRVNGLEEGNKTNSKEELSAE